MAAQKATAIPVNARINAKMQQDFVQKTWTNRVAKYFLVYTRRNSCQGTPSVPHRKLIGKILYSVVKYCKQPNII